FPGSVQHLADDPKLRPDGYRAMSLVFGIAIAVAGLVSSLATRGRDTLAAAPDVQPRAGSAFRADLATSIRDPTLRAVVLSASIFFLASVINGSLSLQYLTYRAGIRDGTSIG